MLKISLVAIATLLVLGGCKEEPRAAVQLPTPAAPAIEVATNSPDATVKRWWRIGEAVAKEAVSQCAEGMKHPITVL